jgi:hypothetical protein
VEEKTRLKKFLRTGAALAILLALCGFIPAARSGGVF